MPETKYAVLQDGRLIYVPHSYTGAKEVIQQLPDYDEETEYVSVSDYIETDTQIEIVMAKYLLQLDDPEEQLIQDVIHENYAPWEDPGKVVNESLEAKVQQQEQVIEELMFIIIPELMGGGL